MDKDISFFRLARSQEKAQSFGESPHASLRYTPQIQLVPRDSKPYFQVLNALENIDIQSGYKVYIVDCNSKKQVECTDHVLITTDNEGRIKVRIAFLLWDFSQVPVFFKIDVDGFATKFVYTNKFLLTDENADLTSRIDYVDKRLNKQELGTFQTKDIFYQSIRLQFYFNNFISATEIDTYYQISTSQNVNPRISIKEYSEWVTQLFNAYTFKRLTRALYSGVCYINQYRNYPAESIEYTPREGMSNISENTFITDQDNNDFLNIFDLIILPDYIQAPFLASSSQLASTSFLISQSTISIPAP